LGVPSSRKAAKDWARSPLAVHITCTPELTRHPQPNTGRCVGDDRDLGFKGVHDSYSVQKRLAEGRDPTFYPGERRSGTLFYIL
jgi:hypothetical protein